MRALPLLLLLLLGVLPASAGTRAYYVGTIGKYPVQMDLTEDGGLSGVYRYDAVGEALTLTPLTVRAHPDCLCMLEQDAQGRGTGQFIGRFSNERRRYSGTWQSADGVRKLAFAVTQVADYRVDRMTGAAPVQRTFPVFRAATPAWLALSGTCGTLARTLSGRDAAVTRHRHTIRIIYYSPRVVSLLVEDRDEIGQPQPALRISARNYRMDGEVPKLLGLDDLFLAKKPYRVALWRLVRPALARQKAARGGGTLAENMPRTLETFTLSRNAITFVYAPGVAGSVSEGEYAVRVPFTAVWSYLNPNGPLTTLVGSVDSIPGLARDPVTGLTAREAVAMGYHDYYNRHQAVTKSWSTAGMAESSRTYAQLRATYNAGQLAALPGERRQAYARVSDALDKLRGAYYDLQWAVQGGTILINMEAADEAEGMDTLGEVIDALRTPTVTDPASRAQARTDMKALRANIDTLTAKPANGYGTDPKLLPAKRQALRQTVEALAVLCARLPDRAAFAVVAFAVEMVRTEYGRG